MEINLKHLSKVVDIDAGAYFTLLLLNSAEDGDVQKLVENNPFLFSNVSFLYLYEKGLIRMRDPNESPTGLHMEYAHKVLKKLLITQDGKAFIGASDHLVMNIIDEYRKLFPSGVYTGSRLVKGDRKGCIKKMQKLMRDNPDVTPTEIIEATKIYVGKAKDTFYEKMTCADYFIEKNGVSMLMGYIEAYREGETTTPTTDFTEDI